LLHLRILDLRGSASQQGGVTERAVDPLPLAVAIDGKGDKHAVGLSGEARVGRGEWRERTVDASRGAPYPIDGPEDRSMGQRDALLPRLCGIPVE
jgi:hypothetical protein